jgi:hypothetical protein
MESQGARAVKRKVVLLESTAPKWVTKTRFGEINASSDSTSEASMASLS